MTGHERVYELPVIDQALTDAASPEVSTLANCIGYALAERGVQLSADDAVKAAERAVAQGWVRASSLSGSFTEEHEGGTVMVQVAVPPILTAETLHQVAKDTIEWMKRSGRWPL